MIVKAGGKIYQTFTSEPEEITITESEYPSYVAMRIHERYSIDDEISIIRQKDEKPEEYAEYYAYCEAVKAEAKTLIKKG